MNEIVNSAADQVVRYLLVGSAAALILVSLAWMILKAARVQTPVYRHMIWLYCLIGTIVLPLLWLAGPKLTLAILPTRAEVRVPVISPPSHDHVGAMAMESFPTVPAETERQSTIGATPRPVRWRTAVAAVWLAGLAFMLTRLAVGWCRLRRICLSATPASRRQIRHTVDGHSLTIRLTRQLHGPVCFGLFRPVILLPEEMYESGTPESLRMVLTHELAHIERRDAWVNLFQRLVEAAYFFHPFVWFASRQLTQQREQICDNYVLAEGVSPADYTTLLSHLGERAVRARYLQTVALFEGQLLARIRGLLDPRGNRQTKLPRRVAAVCTITVLVGFLVSGSVRLAAQPSRGAGTASAKSPPFSASSEQQPPQSVGQPGANSENAAQPRYAARTFNSRIACTVFCGQESSPDGWTWPGRTPSIAPLEIPACQIWGVCLFDPVEDWDLLIKEMSQNRIPGLRLGQATDSDLRHVADCAGLEFLDLRFNSRGVTDAGLAHLKGLTGLWGLELYSAPITDAGLVHLKDLTGLRVLDLRGTQITDAGLVHLKGLKGLEVLGLGETRITDAGLAQLKDLTRLRDVRLWGTQITDAGMEHLKALPRLQRLRLGGTRITDAGFGQLKGLTGWQELALSGTQMTDASLQQIRGLTGLRFLRPPTKITDGGLAYLKDLSGLRTLDLSAFKITDASLVHLKGLTGLAVLWLDGTRITDAGLENLKGLVGLQTLHLERTQITDAGLAHLKGLTELQILTLGGTQITDAGLEHLKGLTRLFELWLVGTRITDAGLEHLKGLPALARLNLSRTQITDGGMENLKGLPALRRLDLSRTQVTDAGFQQVKQSLPHLVIVRDRAK